VENLPIQVPAASKVLIVSFTEGTGIDVTVRRIIGSAWVGSDQSAGFEDQLGAIGACIVTDQALATGVAALPGPATDASDEVWPFWMPVMQGSAKALTASGRDGFIHAFDSKAMRKQPGGTNLAFIAENFHATDAWDLSLGVSVLVSH